MLPYSLYDRVLVNHFVFLPPLNFVQIFLTGSGADVLGARHPKSVQRHTELEGKPIMKDIVFGLVCFILPCSRLSQ